MCRFVMAFSVDCFSVHGHQICRWDDASSRLRIERIIIEIRRRAGDVMPYRETIVRHGSLCNERTRFFFATAVWYTRGKENAARHRCEERIILKLLEMTWPIFGRSGLNVATNVILWESFLMGVLSPLLRGIWRTFSVASLRRRCYILSL